MALDTTSGVKPRCSREWMIASSEKPSSRRASTYCMASSSPLLLFFAGLRLRRLSSSRTSSRAGPTTSASYSRSRRRSAIVSKDAPRLRACTAYRLMASTSARRSSSSGESISSPHAVQKLERAGMRAPQCGHVVRLRSRYTRKRKMSPTSPEPSVVSRDTSSVQLYCSHHSKVPQSRCEQQGRL